MGRSAWAAAACGAFISFMAAGTAAQTAPPALAPVFVAPTLTLPAVPELRLTFPLHPLRVSLTQGELSERTGYGGDPLQLFRWESLWLDRPHLQLLTATTTERALELDCRLTCQPVVSRALELEARVPLPGLGSAVPSTYVFARSSTFYTSENVRPVGLFRAGFAGFLNF